MKVGQMRDPHPVQRGRQARHRDLQLPQAHPAGLEPPPGEPGRGNACKRAPARLARKPTAPKFAPPEKKMPPHGETCGLPGSGFELLQHGLHRQTCRLNFSSDSWKPAASPISCERCRIGMPSRLPVAFSSFDCQASSERWQSGQGVTIASAPASRACSIGWISSPIAVSSRAWMIGKPQALDLRRIVDRLAAARLDDRSRRPRPVGILEAEELRRTQDLAAVERRDLDPLQALVSGLLEQLEALALGDLPEEVPDLDVAVVARRADRLEVGVDALAEAASPVSWKFAGAG